jgi:Glycosyltransferase family 87
MAAAAASVLLGISFYILLRWLERGQLSDVGGYQQHALQIRAGQVPYRDFAFEYPPAALPAELLPAYFPWSYATSFAVLMGACGAGCIAAAASALRAIGAAPERTWAALFATGVSPLVLGSLFDTRFDLWPTLLAVGAAAALVRDRPILSGGLLGLGFAAKLWPVVLVPIAVVHLWRRGGSAAARAAVAAFVVAAAACFLPFAVLAPNGLHAMFVDQLDRPLQVESLGAAVLMAAHHAGHHPLSTITSHGAQALTGRGTGLAADLSGALEILSVVGIWLVFARKRDVAGESTLLASAAAVSALVAFDKVLSPQYLIWLVPFVPLARGRHGIAASGLLLLALGLTQTYFPAHYWALALLYRSPWSWYLLGRDLVLVALAGVLAAGLSRGRDFARRTGGSPAARRAAA